MTRAALTLLVLVAGFVSSAAAATDRPKDVVVPRQVIQLFNGKDFTNFYTWLPTFGRQDPDRVFTVVDRIDGEPAIRVSGQHWGGFVTTANYADYKLVLEYRWTDVTWKPRADRARDSGILIHGQVEDGNYAKAMNSPWLRSLEYQIIEGGTGDLLVL
ncbi:MAG: family 16 glycoside hydrolase, partial [Opitutaceae bacterium]